MRRAHAMAMSRTALDGVVYDRRDSVSDRMRGMLADAIEACLAEAPTGGPAWWDQWQTAADWVSHRGRTELLDFENVCDWLAIDPDEVRSRLHLDRRAA